MKKLIKNLTYNVAQLFFLMSTQKIRILEWGRGTGKSTILAKSIIDCVCQMPRSTGVMVAATYQQILTRTLPSTIAGLEAHGYVKDIHYFVGMRPPKNWNWPEPYEPPLKYNRAMIFWNGTVINFVSQDNSAGSGRGLNTDWVIGDEAALLDEQRFQTDILLTVRGGMNKIAVYPDGSSKYYKDCPLHESITLATSTPVTSKGMWILKYEEQALLNRNKVLFLRASAEVNRYNLGDDYFEKAKATMPDFLYQAEVENKRVKRIEDGFYPTLDEDIHGYNDFDYEYYMDQYVIGNGVDCAGDKDLDRDKPLIIGVDWGSKINCMVVSQADKSEHRVLKNMYVLEPKILDDLMTEEFIPYYKHHRNKVVYMWYDSSGNVGVANSRNTYAEQAKEKLEEAGWVVHLMTITRVNVMHDTKYYVLVKLLKGEAPYPTVKINKSNCKELLISMTNAPAKMGANETIKKDKSSERKKGLDQSHATHLSDAFDVIMFGMYAHYQESKQDFIPPMLSTDHSQRTTSRSSRNPRG